MLLFKNVENLKRFLREEKSKHARIGFVPTMGALHEGHLSLVSMAKENNDIVVASIFVNPTQFNDPEDLKKYPRTEAADILLLERTKCDVLFLPATDEIYPASKTLNFSVAMKNLDSVMEGTFRPGHFEGVMQVVKRLLDIVEPDELIMGQKDFQQFAVIQNMIEELSIPVKLIMGATLRESDGLAMSSRNVRLSNEGRKKAPLIFKTLSSVKENIFSKSADDWKEWAMTQLSEGGFEPEYFEIVDGKTLQPVKRFGDNSYLVACAAARIDGVRLIDNVIILNRE